MFFFRIGERVPRGDHADLRPADVDAVAVAGDLVALQLETDEHALRVRPAPGERLLADEVVVLVGRDDETDPGLERVDLVVELDAREDEPGLDPEDVERVEPEREQPERLARPP